MDALNKFKTKSKDFFQKNIFSTILMVLLILIASLLVYYRLNIQMSAGPHWDTFDFLANSLVFSGKSIGYSDLTRPPFLSFLTSIFFSMGYVSEATIFILDGILFIFGVVGLYLLFKIRFDSLKSFFGCLLYSSFPVVLSFVGAGLSDVSSVSFSIWAFYFTVLAVRKNSKFFYLAFPLIMISFLTRYPAALIIFPIFLYLLLNRNYIKFKDFIIGIFASIGVITPFLIFYFKIFGDPIFPFSYFFKQTYGFFTPEHFAYDPNLLYFVTNLPSFIGLSTAIIFIIALGFFSYGVRRLVDSKNKIKLFAVLKSKIIDKRMETSLFIILLLLFVISFGKIFWMLTELIFFIWCYVTYKLLSNSKIKNLDVKFLFLSWFMTFFIFHSIHVIKDPRFFITMAPALSYLLVEGLDFVSNKLQFKIKNKNITFYVLSLILLFMIFFSTVSYLNEMPRTMLCS
ncbi:MAG: glycosyltransferase family 39 protein [Methanobacterium paludis]|nr:glycosyltransferase family 39 protein [Methanobacterium paludis]